MTERVIEALKAALRIDGKEIVKCHRAKIAPIASSDATADAKNI